MARPLAIKDYLRESQLFLARSVVSLVIVAVLSLILVTRLTALQVFGHEHYATLSRDNRVNIEPLAPTRGLIYDRNGVLLADNQPSYSLELTPEQIDNLDTTLTALREILTIEADDIARFERLRRRKRRFESIPLRVRLNEEEVSRFAVHRHRFPGVDIQARLYRYYPMGKLTSHAVGYVGRIDEAELQALDASNYSATNHIGKVGVEKTYENVLHGRVGFRQVETNAEGRVLRVLERTPPQPGYDLHLNLDVRIQQEAIDALDPFNGAVVALDLRSGAVLALVSKPGYDPNPFVNGIAIKDYQALQRSADNPLFNRALRGQYPPGSTVKPFVGLAGLEYDIAELETRTYCPGYFRLPGKGHKYRDWKKYGHGSMTLDGAIVQSCDVYFYQLSLSLGIDRIYALLSQFGFGKPTGIDITGELAGLLPSRDWKRDAKQEVWFPGETLITGIGQGYSLATPMQLAAATATLARHGKRLRPRMVHAIQNPRDGTVEITESEKLPPVSMVNAANWDALIKSMTRVVHSLRGTAHQIGQDALYRIAGKTGTAQVFTVKQDEEYDKEAVEDKLRDHALFIAFAPVEQPRIAVAVVVENGGSGASVAAPIARRVMDRYLLDDAT